MTRIGNSPDPSCPEKVKDYYSRVLEAFPDTKENFDMLDGMCTGYDGEGADCEP